MNNRFNLFIKKSKRKVMFRLLIILIIIVFITFIEIKLNSSIVTNLFYIIFATIIFTITKKKKKKSNKYNLDSDIDPNIYIPLVYNKEYLNQLSNEFNVKRKIPNNINNLVDYVQFMIDNNNMIFIEKNFDLNSIIYLINNLIKSQGYNIKININDILINDSELFKLRRKDNIQTDYHDLSYIRTILENNQLELIAFYAPNDGFSKLARIDGYILSIIPLSKVETLKELQFTI